MDEFHFPVRTTFIFLLMSFHGTTTTAQTTEAICSAPSPVGFSENNTIGALVTNITTLDGVTLTFEPLNPKFVLEGNQLKAQEVLDYEGEEKSEAINIGCFQAATEKEDNLLIVVLLENINDNPPTFSNSSYTLNVDEFSPVGFSVGAFPAQDLDLPPDLYYTLTSDPNYFNLTSETEPNLLVHTEPDYETVKKVHLVLRAQDTPLTGGADGPSFTATTTITVNIIDVDNRPPWFDPCFPHTLGGGVVVCQSPGYTTTVTLNQREDGALVLKPRQITAVDGDSGIKEEVVFSLLSGNTNNIFAVEPSSGNITMLKAANVLEDITLTVLASQKTNNHQFATTTVTISVHVESLHKPRFQRRSYHGVVSAVGTMALDPTSDDTPLQIIAVDEDYNATEGINPHISYSIVGSSDFSLNNGFLFMARKLEDATFPLQVMATDTNNGESDTAELTVEVKSGVTTTLRPLPSVSSGTSPSTIRTTSSTGSSSSSSSSSTSSSSTISSGSTSSPSSTGSSSSTSSSNVTPTLHTNSPSSSSSSSTPVSQPTSSVTATSHTSHPVTPTTSDPNVSTQTTLTTNQPLTAGGYRVEDMAALGASLAVLLFVCLLVIGLLVYRLKKGDKASRKIFEASRFISALGPGGPKEGIQFTNEAFQKDEDRGSVSSAGDGGETSKGVLDAEEKPRVAELRFSDLPEESEKEVKPILTKERRVEDGYKSVWFKEDIDPNAMNQVVLIPDSREDEEDEEEDEEEEDEEEGSATIQVSDTDLDSGLGVKIEDPGEDSERDDDLNIDL